MMRHERSRVGTTAVRRRLRFSRRGRQPQPRRHAFTLFEMILAIALSVTLVSLIGTAINLYLTRVDRSRTQVEEAQLARALLAQIADDLRAATIYQPQDISAIAQLIASGTPFDVDSIDQPSGGSSGGGPSTGATAGTPSTGGSTAGGASTSTSGGSSSLGTQSSSGMGTETELTMPLGLNGTLEEIYVDATRLPRREELFATVTGYTNAPTGLQANATTAGTGAGTGAASTAVMARPSDLKTVRYFIRNGEQAVPNEGAIAPLQPGAESLSGGLVRQEIPRTLRVWAEQTGNSAVLESGQKLLAPEVAQIEFRYFDGSQVTEYWDMQERGSLPLAIEIRLWITPADASEEAETIRTDPVNLTQTAHQYRQTVYLPMSQIGGTSAASSGGSTSESSSASSSSSTSGSSTGTTTSGGSSFDQ